MKITNKKFFIGISLIIIMSLLSISSVAADTITVTAKPSAKSSLPYKDYTITWENHCPLCGHDGTLVFNPKGTYEGELTCSHCGADYCAVTGKDKNWNGPRAYLKVFKETHSQNNSELNKSELNNSEIHNSDESYYSSYPNLIFRSFIMNVINITSYSQNTMLVNVID